MMRYLSLLIMGAFMFLVSCAAKDPSVYDIKSPCVSAVGYETSSPCAKRSPVMNVYFN